MIASPLEQFELIPLIPLFLGSLDISFTHSSLFMCIGLVAFFIPISDDSDKQGRYYRTKQMASIPRRCIQFSYVIIDRNY